MEEEVVPLTDEERTQLAELLYRQAMTQWQADEDARAAEKATLDPIVTALGGQDGLNAMVEQIEQNMQAVAAPLAIRARRIAQILRSDGGAIINRCAAISEPQPQPEAPQPEPPAEDPPAGEP